MSQTTTQTQTPVVEAIFRYQEPDLSVSADMRALYAQPKPIKLHEEKMILHDLRTDPKLARGFSGLDKHGFTLIEHHTDPAAWDNEETVRNTYIPELEQLVKNLTGCKTAIVNNVAFRRQLPKYYDQSKDYFHPRGGEFDKLISALPSDIALISHKDTERSLEPARGVHLDYSLKGLVDTVRYCRGDMTAAGAETIKALDNGERPPRVAAFSVWRPLKRVTRDPIAVLNWTSPGDIKQCFCPFDYRSKGWKGEYSLEAYMLTKPEKPEDHEWYFVPEQMPHEVLVFKFADTESQYDPNISIGCGHGSPFLVGSEKEEARESIEARVLAFW